MDNDRIAVVGGGIAGLGSAWLLSRRHEVTLFERNAYIGGHSNIVDAPDGYGGSVPVDTGFNALGVQAPWQTGKAPDAGALPSLAEPAEVLP